MLDRKDIEGLLPHAGAMILLDRVESWSEKDIACVTRSHRNAGNPLRRGTRLSAVCGVEYGAQAMAIHGSLISGDHGSPGVLASLRDVNCQVARLDDVAGHLTVHARLLMGERKSFLYAFSISSADRDLVQGQAAVFLI